MQCPSLIAILVGSQGGREGKSKMEDRSPYVLQLKSLRDRLREELTAEELHSLTRAIDLLTADEFTQGALSRLGEGIIHVKVRRRRRQRQLEQPRGGWSGEPEHGEE